MVFFLPYLEEGSSHDFLACKWLVTMVIVSHLSRMNLGPRYKWLETPITNHLLSGVEPESGTLE